MYIYMYVCSYMFTCTLHTYKTTHSHIIIIHTYIHTYIHIYIYICMHPSIYRHVYIYIYMYIVYTHNIFVFMSLSLSIYIYTYCSKCIMSYSQPLYVGSGLLRLIPRPRQLLGLLPGF